MRVIVIPDFNDPGVWVVLGILVLVVAGILIYQWLRPPAVKRVLEDGRYQQALSIFAANLPREREETREERQAALTVAVDYLATEHGVPAEEVGPNLKLLVAEYDKDRSYDLRYEAIAYEQAGAYDLALEYFERAARLREEHDPKDYQFLQGCIRRVRARVRPRTS